MVGPTRTLWFGRSLAAIVLVAGLAGLPSPLGLFGPSGAPETGSARGSARAAAPERQPTEGSPSEALPTRIVSLNPSLTAILLALGAGHRLVGVDAWSLRQHPELGSLATVGGLYDPSLEAVVALEPDLVVVVPSAEQHEFRSQVVRLGIEVAEFDPVRFDEVLASIEALGERVGRENEARARTAEIRAVARRIETTTRSLPTLRTVLVLQREPLFVVGSGSFIDEMLTAAGARNLGAELDGRYPRASLEWLIAARPEVILDAAGEPVRDEGDARSGPRTSSQTDATERSASMFWSRWPSLPAVEAGRVESIPAQIATLPGPDLDRALEVLARAIHGDALVPGDAEANP